MKKTNSLDMTEGSIVKKLLLFAMPILASYLIQHFYSIADSVVVGNFAPDGTTAQAAIGASTHAINMLMSLCTGLSLGANVICSKLRGARDHLQLRKAMHTAVLLSVFLGIGLMIAGLTLSKPVLLTTSTPADILPSALAYMRIRFFGVPATIALNFSIAIMRSNGDTKRSMYILSASGLVNVVLNLVLVVCFRMGAEGVAIATIVSQYLSAFAIVRILFKPTDEYKLQVSELQINKKLLFNIIAIAIPCGINGILQSFSNVILQSSVNAFGKIVIAGNSSATSILSIVYLVKDAFSAACISFTGQCYGAKAYKRLDKVALIAIICNGSMILAIAAVITVFSRQLLGLFNPAPAVVEAGMFKLLLLVWTTIFFGISDNLVACMRGMEKSLRPTVINLICICGIRYVWVLLIFPMLPHTPEYLYLCYPLSWFVAMVAQAISFIHCRKNLQ